MSVSCTCLCIASVLSRRQACLMAYSALVRAGVQRFAFAIHSSGDMGTTAQDSKCSASPIPVPLRPGCVQFFLPLKVWSHAVITETREMLELSWKEWFGWGQQPVSLTEKKLTKWSKFPQERETQLCWKCPSITHPLHPRWWQRGLPTARRWLDFKVPHNPRGVVV